MSESTAVKFRIGGVLGRGFSIFFDNILAFGLLAIVINSPTYLYTLITGRSSDPSMQDAPAVAIAVLFLNLILSAILTATLAYGTFQGLRGRRAGLGECISRGLAVMLPVIGVSILLGLCIGLGMVVFVIPGIFMMVALWVAIPAAVVESPGVTGSLGRSWELTSGYRWQILGIILIIIILTFVAAFALAFAAELTIGGTATVIAEWFLTAASSALYAVISTVGYHDLRVAKEGIGIEQIAAVFD